MSEETKNKNYKDSNQEENLVTKNNIGFININLENSIKNCNDNFLDIIKKYNLLLKLQKVEKFFNSNEWKLLEKIENGHDIGYLIVKSILGNIRFLFFDNDIVTHDEYGLFSSLSDEQKEHIKLIDSSKKSGLFKSGNIIIRYIGSTSVTEVVYPLPEVLPPPFKDVNPPQLPNF